ncbi:unnamed protein product [Musa acuminata subsp. burmannicoides]
MAVAGSQACHSPSIKPQPERVDVSPVRERGYSSDTEWNRRKRIRNIPLRANANAGLLVSHPVATRIEEAYVGNQGTGRSRTKDPNSSLHLQTA